MRTIQFEGKKHRIFRISPSFGYHRAQDVICVERSYESGGSLAIELLCVDNDVVTEPYAILTVNLDYYSGWNVQTDKRAYVDDNNNGSWGCLDFIEENKLGEPTGIMTPSGFCLYPLYEFDTKKFYAD